MFFSYRLIYIVFPVIKRDRVVTISSCPTFKDLSPSSESAGVPGFVCKNITIIIIFITVERNYRKNHRFSSILLGLRSDNELHHRLEEYDEPFTTLKNAFDRMETYRPLDGRQRLFNNTCKSLIILHHCIYFFIAYS